VTLRHLDLDDFRIFRHAHVAPELEGTTVITGANGTGKTSVLEALAYLGTRRSFRGAPPEALVRTGASAAIVRAEIDNAGAPSTVDAEISLTTRSRVRVNRKSVSGRRALGAASPCTLFSPEDLSIVSGGPKGRRDLLDDALGLLDPEGARAADATERIVRQRAALLRQSAGRPSTDVTTTLDVWDQRLTDAAKILVAARERLVADLACLVDTAYAHIAGADGREVVRLAYVRSWAGDLSSALEASRRDDLRRGVTTVGPHRDDLSLVIDGREARTHASQGEQRCLALALRLGVHQLVRARTSLVPILLLDDVFSELDPVRSRALVTALPAGQCLVTTAAPLPDGIAAARVIPVEALEKA
jgi:DNA replication and repair protein RecF